MTLYLTGTTDVHDLFIDSIEVKLKNGKTALLSWNRCNICRTESGFEGTYWGVHLCGRPAKNQLFLMNGLTVSRVGLYFREKPICRFAIEEMEFWEDGESLYFISPYQAERKRSHG